MKMKIRLILKKKIEIQPEKEKDNYILKKNKNSSYLR